MSDQIEECIASGEGHYFRKELIPSEFINGEEGGEPTLTIQCQYCGKVKED